jgi:hypothetical protein
MAAVKCVVREVSDSLETIGLIIGRLPFRAPLDTALRKLWGFASQQGRHL